jgi:hypothetical protein
MRVFIVVAVVICTVLLVVAGLLLPGRYASTIGVVSGEAVPGFSLQSSDPQDASSAFWHDVQQKNWSGAHARLANADKIDQSLFVRDVAGDAGSLRTMSTLQTWDIHPLHATDSAAQMRCALTWSSAVGPIHDLIDLNLVRQDGAWKINWPNPNLPNVPAQVIPVNYLRWDLVTPSSGDDWGERNVDAPRVRIISMNAVDYAGGSVIMGEAVNEDTIPAFINVNAKLIGKDGNALDEESSFDKISHVLLPKQVTPYRIDFPTVPVSAIKNVQMDAKATLVPASADPVIGVMDQKFDVNATGKKVLSGQLLNQSGQVVDIPHVIATFYDNNGKVIWVADGYVDHSLFPLTPEPFSVELPAQVAANVHNYHVVVNQYTLGKIS